MLEFVIVLALVLLNGVFSLSELAVISARRARLLAMVEAGRSGARSALALAEDPGRFLSTVQIGITLVGVVSGAFSGSTLGARATARLLDQGLPPAVAEALGFGSVVALVTYLSIVIGELVPKRLGLSNPESLACRVAPVMTVASKAISPLVWLLDVSSDLIFRLLGVRGERQEKVSNEDLRALAAEAELHGSIEAAERRMISGVLRLGDRAVRAVMTPRGEVEWLDVLNDPEALKGAVLAARHSKLPVGRGSKDAFIGVIVVRDALAALARGDRLELQAHLRKAPVVPDTADALDLLDALRGAAAPMAFVHDEYGHFEGLVTPADINEVVIGAFRSDTLPYDEEPAAVRREDGSWLLAGWMPVDEAAERLKIELPSKRRYQTVAGLVLNEMGRLPQVGERVDLQGWRIEVVDLDGRRIDKVLATPRTERPT